MVVPARPIIHLQFLLERLMQNPLAHKAFSAVRWTTVNAVCQAGIQLLTLAVLGRLLGPAAFGLMAMIMVVVEVVNVFARMGLGEAIIHKQDVTHNEVSSLYFLSILVGLALFVLVFLSSNLIAWLYSEPELAPLVNIASSVFFISSLGLMFQVLLRKHLLFDILSRINILSSLGAFVFMVILALRGAGVFALVWGQVFLHAVMSMALIMVAWEKGWLPSPRFRLAEVTWFLKFGLYRMSAMFANQVNSRVDQMLIGGMLGSVAVGFYSIAFRITYLPINLVSPILTQVALPFFSEIQDDTPRLRRNYLKYINLILSINTPVLAGIAALSPVLVPVLLGYKWIPVVPIIQALTFYIFIRSIFNASGSLMMAKGRADWVFYWSMAMLFIIPIGTYATLKASASVIGVCLALGGIFFVAFFFHYWLFLRNLLGAVFNQYMLTIARPFVLAASMGVLTYLLSLPLQAWPDAVALLLLLLFAVSYYSVMTLIFNPRFVDELERVAPTAMGNALFRVRRWAGFPHEPEELV